MMGVQQTPFWLKSASAFGVLVPLSGLLWVLELCGEKISKLNLILLIILGLFFFVISYSNDLVLSNIRKIYLGGFEGERGPFFIPFWCYIFGILLFIIYILISSYLKATGVRRLQLLYVIIGAILYISTVVSVSFILPLFEIRHFIPLDTPSSIFLIFFTTLAITRYHLFEIKVILTEILVGAMGIVLLVLPFLMPTANLKILTLGIFILFLIFGYLLVKYTHQEIKRKEELEEAYKRIEALSEMKSEFLKVVNHQLRTPVSIIKGMAAMLREGKISKERQREFVEKLYLSSERLGTILDDILVAHSLTGGMERPNFSPCQIEEIVEKQVEHFKLQAEAKGIKILFKKPKETLPITLADQTMVERIISRLIDNAILYSEKGEIEVSIDLEKENKKEWIKISVKDQGIGLDERDKENLFKLFYRGEKATFMHPNGSGLGLFIVKNYVEAHRGKIEAKSEGRGKGSTFIVALPVITEL
jgi:signal transduction histidine kinase